MIWLALAFLLVALLGSAAYAGVRAWRLWRTFRGASERGSDAIGRVLESAAAAERRATGLTAKTEALTGATARLQLALAELAVIRRAAAEPRTLLGSIRGSVPRK